MVPGTTFTKECGCGRFHTAEQWNALRLIGYQPAGERMLLELRDCLCHSTIAIEVPLVTPGEDVGIACCRRCGRCEELSVWRGLAVCEACRYYLVTWAQNTEAQARAHVRRAAQRRVA
jgi:hypothetical protein